LAGGGTKDPAWRQMLADILGRPLAPVEVAAASGLGAANLGARAADLPTRRTRPRDDLAAATVLPAAHGDLYCERRQAFHRTLRSLRDIDATSIGSHKRVTPGHSS
jgi:xylulokinase